MTKTTHFTESQYALKYYHNHATDKGESVRLEIYERTAETLTPKAIGELRSLVLNVQGAQEDIDSAIVKTSLSFSMVDTYDKEDTTTKHGSWSEFYTPDSTKFLVKVKSGTTLRWSGYITPDSWEESLDYYGDISITARDNIGHLQDFKFDASGDSLGLISVYDLLKAAADKVALPMQLEMNDQAEDDAHALSQGSTLVRDMLLNVSQFDGDTWYEVVEKVLGDLGYVLRFTDYNTITICPLRNMTLCGHTDRDDVEEASLIFLGGGIKSVNPAYKSIVETLSYDYSDTIDYDTIKGLDFTGSAQESVPFTIDYKLNSGHGTTNFTGAIDTSAQNTGLGWNGTKAFKKNPVYSGYETELDATRLSLVVANANDSVDRAASYNFGEVKGTNVTLNIGIVSRLVTITGGRAYETNAYLTSFDWQLKYVSGSDTWYYKHSGNTWVQSTPQTNTYETASNYESEFSFDLTGATVTGMPQNGKLVLVISHPWFYGEKVITASEGFFFAIRSLSLAVPSGEGVSGSTIRSINDETYNVENSKDSKIGAISRKVSWFSPQNYKNVLYKRSNADAFPTMADFAFGWDGQNGLPLPVMVHLQRLCFHLTAMETLQGDCELEDNASFTFDTIYEYKDSHYFLMSGSLDFVTGRMSDGYYRQYLDYEDVWDERTPEYDIKDGVAGSGSGGSGSSSSSGSGSSSGGSRVTWGTETNDSVILSVNNEEKKIMLADKLFTPEYDAAGNLVAIKALAGFYSDSFVSAGGKNSGGGGGGSANAQSFILPAGSTSYSTAELSEDGEFDSADLVLTLYDDLNRVVFTDMKVASSGTKWTVNVTFKEVTSVNYKLVVIG